MRILPLLFVIVLSACGKTGDLYLPDDKAAETPPAKVEMPSKK